MKKHTKIFILAVLILLLLGAAAFLFVQETKENKITELFNYAELTRKEFKNKPGYWGLNNKLLIEKGLINNSKENRISNRFNKDVVIGTDFEGYTVMPGSKTFDIAYLNLSHKECIDLLTHELKEEQEISLVSVKVRNKDKTTEFSWGGENKLPISQNAAKKVCNIKGNSDILWTFE